jgi:hypothetical protein
MATWPVDAFPMAADDTSSIVVSGPLARHLHECGTTHTFCTF